MKIQMLKNKLIICIVLLTVIFVNTSFSYKNNTAAYVRYTFHANTSAVAYVELNTGNPATVVSTSNIPQVTSWSAAMVYGNGTITLLTLFGSNHPAGVLRIYRDGVLVKSHTVPANAPIAIEDTFSWTYQPIYEAVW